MTIVPPLLGLVMLFGQPLWMAGNMGDFVLAQWHALADGQRRWVTREQRMQLTMVDGYGTKRRDIVAYEKRATHAPDGIQKRSIVFMVSPPEQRNTAFLGYVFTDARPSEKWTYLPALKRPRQVTSGASEFFMGSHLSYDDLDLLEALDAWPLKQGRATLLGARGVGGVACHELLLEVDPAHDAGETYSRLVLLLGQRDFVPRRIELHARADDALVKIITQEDIAFSGPIPVARRTVVEMPGTGRRTEIAIPLTRFDGDLSDDLFEQSALERGIPAS